MRYASYPISVTIILGLVIAGVLYSHTAFATGNVLLPSDGNSSDSSVPNLGLDASSPRTGSNTSDTPPKSTPSAPSPTIDSSDQSKKNALQAQAASMAKLQSMNSTDYITSTVSTEAAAKLGSGSIPTHIVHEPDMGATLPPDNNRPYVLAISFSNQSIFGANDVRTIHDKLGLSPSQIASSCVLTARGMIRTDKSSYLVYNSTGAMPIQLNYDGMIQNYLLGALALCVADANHLPTGSGYIIETNGRFVIPLQSINCLPPNRQVSSVIITYNGSSTGHCTYN